MWKKWEIVTESERSEIARIAQMHMLYEKLENNTQMRLTWIKNKLPWYITKFHKITSTEIILRDTSIFIGVNFGKSKCANCYIEITPRDMGWS